MARCQHAWIRTRSARRSGTSVSTRWTRCPTAARSPSARRPLARRYSSRSATPATAFRRTMSPTSSSLSIPPSPKAAGSASRSSIGSCAITAVTSPSAPILIPEPSSRSSFRSPRMPETRVLVVDDERSMRELLSITLGRAGYHVTLADGGAAAMQRLRAESFALVVTDLRMRDVDGMAVLRAARERDDDTVVVVVTAYASTETAVEAMKLGAYDYVTKPFKLDEIRVTLANALERKRLKDENRLLRRQLVKAPFDGFVGRSPGMVAIFETIRKIADSASTVMVTGESGTGKELVARAVHGASSRRDGPFVSVNCGAVPDTLMEAELFGHVKGAFTGAVAASEGLFAAADGGTLFLDEITEIAPALQVKLLRAVQERRVRRIGDVRDVAVDVRLIAASNRDLARAVADGVLREALFYRLNVIPIHLPPLRERREDIPHLVSHFIEKVGAAQGKTIRGVTPDAMAVLEAHH